MDQGIQEIWIMVAFDNTKLRTFSYREGLG